MPESVTDSWKTALTYYVCRNPMPKGKAELRLAVRAGSVMEDEHERGLAHFTEHMAFKGSRHDTSRHWSD